MRNLLRLFAFILLLGTILFPIYAFASSNSGAGASGEGAATISGWSVSNIHYQFSDDPSTVQSVTFELDAPAAHVSVKLNSQSTDFTTCHNISGYHWQCDFHAVVQVSSMDEFRIVATGN